MEQVPARDATQAGRASKRAPRARVLEHAIRGKRAWTRASIRDADFRVVLGADVLREIAACMELLRLNPLQTELLSPEDYRLARTRILMCRVRRVLESGVGFAVLDRLPVDSYDKEQLKAIYWLLSGLMSRPVAQSFRGTMLYDVHDTGRIKGPAVRADVTRQELAFHTDYGYNEAPQFIGLAALRSARSGGRNSFASLYAAHNVLRREAPDLLARLYEPFCLNRYGEHAAGDPRFSRHPVFAYDGRTLKARFNHRNIVAGHDLAGEALDGTGAAAIDALTTILESTALRLDLDLAPGQILYTMNWRIAHSRTEFVDHVDPERRRHLVRIFLRDHGARTYNG
ncbi:MAG TPA: TauD/TfdA family dioxygenase [Xanthomonadaceae bacterium]|nr:TauD/TfdA family dioxygenase [Xanthomonadaceae bacterium]